MASGPLCYLSPLMTAVEVSLASAEPVPVTIAFVPQMTLEPTTAEVPQITLVPQVMLVPETFVPQMTLVPQATLVPHATLEPSTRVV